VCPYLFDVVIVSSITHDTEQRRIVVAKTLAAREDAEGGRGRGGREGGTLSGSWLLIALDRRINKRTMGPGLTTQVQLPLLPSTPLLPPLHSES